MLKRILVMILVILTAVSTAILLYSCGTDTKSIQSTQSESAAITTSTAAGAAKEAKTVTVTIKDFKFDPANITINKGDTVVWTNKDSMAHTATGDKFDSGNLDNGASFKFTFNEAGDFSYICSYHPDMKGNVTVN